MTYGELDRLERLLYQFRVQALDGIDGKEYDAVDTVFEVIDRINARNPIKYGNKRSKTDVS